MASGVIERRRPARPARPGERGIPRLRLLTGEGGGPGEIQHAAGRATPTRSPRPAAAVAARRDAVVLVALVVGFSFFGLVMVLSSSSVESIANYGSP